MEVKYTKYIGNYKISQSCFVVQEQPTYQKINKNNITYNDNNRSTKYIYVISLNVLYKFKNKTISIKFDGFIFVLRLISITYSVDSFCQRIVNSERLKLVKL